MLDRPKPPRRRRSRPPAAEVTPETPIWCPWCQAEHPASVFNKETRKFSGLSGICRQAQAEKRKTPREREKTQARNNGAGPTPPIASAVLRLPVNVGRSLRAPHCAIADAWLKKSVGIGVANFHVIAIGRSPVWETYVAGPRNR